MCGICGFTGEVLDRDEVIKRMTDVITPRGPDSSGVFAGDGVTMGFRRLSIIDVGNTGDQPIYNEDRTLVLTFNGEIYNYQDLRKELLEKGMEADLKEIEKDIEDRDYRDMHREHSPLKQAEDAVLLDTSSMTLAQVVEEILKIVREKGYKAAGGCA